METITWSRELTDKINLKDSQAENPEISIMISLFLKYWMLYKSDINQNQLYLLRICEERKYQYLDNLKQAIDYISQQSFETFLNHIDDISLYSNLFQDIGICKKSMTKTAKINMISKQLQLMIIKQTRSNLDIKEFYCGYIDDPWIIYIVEESIHYYPAIHRDEKALINHPSKDLNQFPFRLNSGLCNEKQKNLPEKVTKLIDLLEGSIEFLKPDIKNKLIQFLKSNKVASIEQNKIEKFKKLLSSNKDCSNHKKNIFDCGNIHCVECIGLSNVCRCGIRFDLGKINQINRMVTPVLTSPQIRYMLQSNPQLNYQPTPSNQVISNSNSNLVVQQNLFAGSVGSAPVYHINAPPLHQGLYQILQQKIIIVECWVCLRHISTFESIGCQTGHYICADCYKYSLSRCSICENLICAKCNLYILGADIQTINNFMYHSKCAYSLGLIN